MVLENVDELERKVSTVEDEAKLLKKRLHKFRLWMSEFSEANPATPGQISEKLDAINVTDLEEAFNEGKAVYLNSDVIPDPVEN